MFEPKFTYTDELVSNLGQIRELVGGTKVRRHLENSNKKPASLSHELICKINRQVMQGELASENAIGEYRQHTLPVSDLSTNQTIYLPPEYSDVPSLMNDLIGYVEANKTNADPLIKVGVFYKQFLIIQPFTAGNDKTASRAAEAMLKQAEPEIFGNISLENHYNTDPTSHFSRAAVLGNYYDQYRTWDFTGWLEYFTEGVADELQRVSKLLTQPTMLSDRLESYHQKILNLLEKKGIIKDSDYAKVTNRSRATRALDFQKMIKLNLIERRGKGRGSYYVLK